MTQDPSGSAPNAAAKPTPWAPFRHRAFTLLWTATLLSNIGTWMHDVGAGWLMTLLDPSPATVALVQAANMAPIFCFALFAGALADRFDKRKILLLVNVLLVLVISLMTVLVRAERMTPTLLVLFTFAIGSGAAFAAPAWQAVVPRLVPRETLSSALALNSLGINLSRAIGPAIAGVLITAVGIAAPFAVNALSCVVAAAALMLWRTAPDQGRRLPPEPLLASIGTGLRQAANNAPLKATLLRAGAFFLCASAFWALLPLIARDLPNGGSGIYGVLLACVGAGAVGGALLLPRWRQRVGTHRLAGAASLVLAVALALMAFAKHPYLAVAAALLGGLAWIATMVSLNLSAQASLPNWVRARGLAVFLMVFSGGMTFGSLLWGQLAQATSISTALLVAAVGAVLPLPLLSRVRLGQGEDLDLSPSMSWDQPVVAETLEDAEDRGPVMVTVEYEIDPEDEKAFLDTLHRLSRARYGDGAHQWGIKQDAAEPNRWVEWFLLPSWAEHLRQHDRATHADEDLHAAAQQFHRGEGKPLVRHLIAPARRDLS